MGKWKKTACVLCALNCGIEVYIEDNKITKVKGDRDNPRSKGYICMKGANVSYHQHNKQRLQYPLKKVNGSFVKISWEEATGEIAEKLKSIVDTYGPKSLAYMGGGGQGSHFEAAFGLGLLRALGSKYHYSALAQELTGMFWNFGRFNGKQYLMYLPDESEADIFIGIGWNGMVSHQLPRAPLILKEIAKNPNKKLVIIDPRKSETAKIANLHLPVKPGTDALLIKAMIAIILENGWEKREYINDHINGFDKIVSWFTNFDYKEAVSLCGLDFKTVKELSKEICDRKTAFHPDLGVYMSRHSTANSYLELILMAISGNLCVRGGGVIPGTVMPLGSHTDERDEKTWRTVETDFPAIMGYFPPNVMPEEILSNKPERLRAVLCSASNPLRSYADTPAYEKAFGELDLLVTSEIVMTETAVMSHYVLPAQSAYESWDGTFFPLSFPEIYFQMRPPVVKPDGEQKEVSEIYTMIADHLGIIPDIPKELQNAAKGSKLEFAAAVMGYLGSEPKAVKVMPFILAKTLGKEVGSVNLAALWGMLMTAPKTFRENAIRIGYEDTPFMGDKIFQDILDNPQGLFIGKVDENDNFAMLKTEDKKIHIHIPEMEEWINNINVESEKKELEIDPEYPFILSAGRHYSFNANTLMRNPQWLKGERACTCLMNPVDAEKLSFIDRQTVKVITEAGAVEIELEVSDEAREGQVIIPHGFGMEYDGKFFGVNVNYLTKNTHRDKLAATPLHRYILCRIESTGK